MPAPHGKLTKRQREAVLALTRVLTPKTTREIARELPWSVLTVRQRLVELESAGLVCRDDEASPIVNVARGNVAWRKVYQVPEGTDDGTR